MKKMKLILALFLSSFSLLSFAQSNDATLGAYINANIRGKTYRHQPSSDMFQSLVDSKINIIYGVTATGTDTYAAGVGSTITSYVTGQHFMILFNNSNTGAATINLTPSGGSALGAISIVKNGGTALSAGDIQEGAYKWLAYDGTNFQILSGETSNVPQSTIVGITGTKAEFNTAVTDGDFMYQSDSTGFWRTSGTTNLITSSIIKVDNDSTVALLTDDESKGFFIQDGIVGMFNSANSDQITIQDDGMFISLNANIGDDESVITGGSGGNSRWTNFNTLLSPITDTLVSVTQMMDSISNAIDTLGGGGLTFDSLKITRTVTGADAIEQNDQFRIVKLNSASPFNFTIDELDIGTQVTLRNIGTATVTLVPGSGVTIDGVTTLPAGEDAVVIYTTATEPEIKATHTNIYDIAEDDGIEYRFDGDAGNHFKNAIAMHDNTSGSYSTEVVNTALIPNNSLVQVTVYVAGINSDGSEGYGGSVTATFRKTSGGTVTLIGSSAASVQEDISIGTASPALSASSGIQLGVTMGTGTWHHTAWGEYILITY